MNTSPQQAIVPQPSTRIEHEATTIELAEAAAFYAQLPLAARSALRAMGALGAEEAKTAAAQAAGHAIVQSGLESARRRGSEAARRTYPDGQLPSEEAVIEEAVRLVREAQATLR